LIGNKILVLLGTIRTWTLGSEYVLEVWK